MTAVSTASAAPASSSWRDEPVRSFWGQPQAYAEELRAIFRSLR